MNDNDQNDTPLPPTAVPAAAQVEIEVLIDTVLKRTFERIANVLLDEDMVKVKELDAKDPSGEAVHYFLLAKVANYDKILEEEVERVKKKQ